MATNPLAVLAVLMVGGLALAGCRAEEQGRVLMYEPGTYLGQEDSELDESTLEQLRDRHAGQSF